MREMSQTSEDSIFVHWSSRRELTDCKKGFANRPIL